jgi:glycosyltransferase involved in cell wall biosynthesis
MGGGMSPVEARRAQPAGKRRLRILLSAYACEPDKGSEPGVGWHWALGLARAGHDVWVITRANNAGAIEHALGTQRGANLQFVYYDLPRWLRGWKRGARGVRTYYVLWQWGAYRLARRLCRDVRFDVVHHITFGVFRHPSFMAFLGVPFVFGPVGGGEAAPRALRATFPLRGRVIDRARDVANWMVRIDPLMAAVYRRSAAILCKTGETRDAIPARYRDKCRLQLELGIDDPDGRRGPHPPRAAGRFRILYVGRLVYLKGVHLGLAALARLRKTHPEATLTIIGSGPDEAWLRREARRLGVDDAVTWVPWLERAAVMRAYAGHDAFLFPSLHDSSGNAVLEALSSGLPVVCIAAGGPAVLADPSCAFLVPPGTPGETVNALADALARLADDTVLARSMVDAAVRRARQDFSWDRQVARMEQLYHAALPAPAAQGAQAAR